MCIARRVVACLLGFVILLGGLGGCAVGNKYEYRNSISGLPPVGARSVSVEVVDERPYVVSGDKTPDFVGVQRGGYGNTFAVKTVSGAPLANDMESAISTALERQGLSVVEEGSSPSRRMQLRVREWKTDVMLRMKVVYDLSMYIFDEKGDVLAESRNAGEDVLGGGFEEANSGNAARSFEMRFTELMRSPDIQKALQ
jgi:hypothetical protein